MGNLLGFIGDLIPIIGGVALILFYGGYIKPEHQSEENKEKYEAMIKKRKSFFVPLGYLVVIIGIFTLASRFMQDDLDIKKKS